MNCYKIYITEINDELDIVNHYDFILDFECDLDVISYTLKMLKHITTYSPIPCVECETDYQVKINTNTRQVMTAYL